jgi:hypothetical protein
MAQHYLPAVTIIAALMVGDIGPLASDDGRHLADLGDSDACRRASSFLLREMIVWTIPLFGAGTALATLAAHDLLLSQTAA